MEWWGGRPKKLVEAAQKWVLSGRLVTPTTDDSLRDDALAFGIDPDSLPEPAMRESDELSIFPENWDTVNVFLALSNAWVLHIPAMGGPPRWRGLPRTEIESTLRLMDLWPKRADLLPRLLIMESAALKALNAKA